MMREAIDLGNAKFDIKEEWYEQFMNQTVEANAVDKNKEEFRHSRDVFKYDWQRFLWAFILGIYDEKKTPIQGKSKQPFGTAEFFRTEKIKKFVIGLTLQAEYSNDPDKLKIDFENAAQNNENFGIKVIKKAIEEYANTGFEIIDSREREKHGYIENLEYVIEDILSDKKWNMVK